MFPFRQRQIEVFEERQKRLLSEVAAERSEGDQRGAAAKAGAAADGAGGDGWDGWGKDMPSGLCQNSYWTWPLK